MSSTRWNSDALLEPIRPERPCGENLEDLAPLTTLDALRLFGQVRSPDAPPEADESRKPVDWADVRALALGGLARSKDLRLLAYLATASLRTDGLPAFFETITVASRWLDAFWPDVHPLVDEDAIARRNALNCFADPMAVLDRLRRAVVVESRQHGRFSLRDIDIAKGTLQPGSSEARPELAQIDAAFAEMPLEALVALQQGAEEALAAVNRIDAKMRDHGGAAVAPGFEPLSAQLARLHLVLQAHATARLGETDAASEGAPAAVGTNGSDALAAPNAITSRQDAIRALDAVAEFFRRTEPSSPVPLLLDRARRLVSKSFLEVLEDIAPDALAGARAVGGLKDSD